MKTLALLMLLTLVAGAQQRSKLVINSESEEGKLLQEIEQQTDEGKKQALLQQFAAKYPRHKGAPWVYEQLQAVYLKHNEFDQTLDAGSKALAIDGNDLDAAYHNLKAAEGKKDADLVKKWALETSGIARKAGGEDPKQAEYSKQVDVYCEYALYVAAVQSTDPAKTMDLVESLEQLNGKSQYLRKVYGTYLNALRQNGQAEKAGEMAEKLADDNSASPTVLLIAADYNLQKKNEPDKVILYSTKLLDSLKDDSDADEKKSSLAGLANWMLGVTYTGQVKYGQADKSLRAALPNLNDEQVRASALFYLGLADYQLGKATKHKEMIRDALQYSQQSAAIKSPLQAQAEKNVRVIKGELGLR